MAVIAFRLRSSTPMSVMACTDTRTSSGAEHHSLFLFSDGSVWSCGRCDDSQLGLPDKHQAIKDDIVADPQRITFPNEDDGEAKIVQISAGTRCVAYVAP